MKKNIKLPGTRILSELLNVNRNTIIASFQELANQGWIIIQSSKGAFVSEAIPEITPKPINSMIKTPERGAEAGFFIRTNNHLDTNVYIKTGLLEINDGLPDIRLAPLESLSREIRSVLKGQRGKIHLSYDEIEGNRNLRSELVNHLNNSRGFNLEVENLLISRGSVNSLFLACSVLIEKDDNVIVAELGYRAINMIVKNIGAHIIPVPIDDGGLSFEAIEKICKTRKVRAMYVTPHHHYPTTVTMPPQRRMALLGLAEKYGIAILEDDYDYDYHYRHSPFLPLASADPAGVVIYIGSLSKTFSPAFRVGYMAAPKNFIREVAKLRRIVDRQGDSILEQALSELFKQGDIESHLKKSQKEYKLRRDKFCNILNEDFKEVIDFKIPEGGLAVWAHFRPNYKIIDISKRALSKGLYLLNGSSFNTPELNRNATRLGFASLNLQEITEAMQILKNVIM